MKEADIYIYLWRWFVQNATVDQPFDADRVVHKSSNASASSSQQQVPVPVPLVGPAVVAPTSSHREFTEGIQRLPDGTPVFRARFDVRGFDPGEVSVRVVRVFDDAGKPSNKLAVSASHIEDAAPARHRDGTEAPVRGELISSNRRQCREFNREVYE